MNIVQATSSVCHPLRLVTRRAQQECSHNWMQSPMSGPGLGGGSIGHISSECRPQNIKGHTWVLLESQRSHCAQGCAAKTLQQGAGVLSQPQSCHVPLGRSPGFSGTYYWSSSLILCGCHVAGDLPDTEAHLEVLTQVKKGTG